MSTMKLVGKASKTGAQGLPLRDSLRPRGPVRFEVAQQHGDDGTVLKVAGELDALTAVRLAAVLDDIVRRHEGGVVVDLTGLAFIDSAGLQLLLSARRRLTRVSRRMSVICPPGRVRRVIELTRLIETLGVQ